MPEAVIVATARTPIGRAFKGSLVDMRPDDLTALIVRAALGEGARARPPQRRRPASSAAASRPANPASTSRAWWPFWRASTTCPGVTVNRYCSSSLQTIRMAAHAIRAGEGDVFVAAGVETVSRFGNGASDSGQGDEPALSRRASSGRQERSEKATAPWTPRHGPARHLHRHGPDRGERGGVRATSRASRWTSSRCAAKSSPSRTRRTASSSVRSSRSRSPTAPSSRRTTDRAPARRSRSSRACSRSSARAAR